jgi:hypothetical protein
MPNDDKYRDNPQDLQPANPGPAPRYRRQVRDKRVKRFRCDLLRVSPQLDDPKYRPVVESFARISLLALDSYEFLRARGLVGKDGELRGATIATVRQLVDSQLKMAQALGLVPGAEVNDTIIDMEAIGARVARVMQTKNGKAPTQ